MGRAYKNKSTFESVEEVLQYVSFDWSSVISEIQIWSTNNEKKTIVGENISWSLAPQYPLCQIINIYEYNLGFSTSVWEVYIILGEISNLEVSLKFQETNKVLQRSLKSNMLAYNGPTLTIKDPRERELRAIVSISQEINSAKDKTARCTNYPNETYITYNECDKYIVNYILKDDFNITPFWSTKGLDTVTKLRK